MGKSLQKETLKKQFGRKNRMISKKKPHCKKVPIILEKSSSKIIRWKIIPIFYWEITRIKLSKKRFGRTAIFHSKKILGETPKNLKKSLGKSIQTKNHTSFYWENPYKKKHWKKQFGRDHHNSKQTPLNEHPINLYTYIPNFHFFISISHFPTPLVLTPHCAHPPVCQKGGLLRGDASGLFFIFWKKRRKENEQKEKQEKKVRRKGGGDGESPV